MDNNYFNNCGTYTFEFSFTYEGYQWKNIYGRGFIRVLVKVQLNVGSFRSNLWDVKSNLS